MTDAIIHYVDMSFYGWCAAMMLRYPCWRDLCRSAITLRPRFYTGYSMNNAVPSILYTIKHINPLYVYRCVRQPPLMKFSCQRTCNYQCDPFKIKKRFGQLPHHFTNPIFDTASNFSGTHLYLGQDGYPMIAHFECLGFSTIASQTRINVQGINNLLS